MGDDAFDATAAPGRKAGTNTAARRMSLVPPSIPVGRRPSQQRRPSRAVVATPQVRIQDVAAGILGDPKLAEASPSQIKSAALQRIENLKSHLQDGSFGPNRVRGRVAPFRRFPTPARTHRLVHTRRLPRALAPLTVGRAPPLLPHYLLPRPQFDRDFVKVWGLARGADRGVDVTQPSFLTAANLA